MERYAKVLRQLELIQHAIQHTYDAAHDECTVLEVQMPSQFYVTALKNLVDHRDALRAELVYIRQEEIVEEKIAQMAVIALRIDRLKEWMAHYDELEVFRDQLVSESAEQDEQ